MSCKLLIISEILVEATGVELFNALTTSKSLIPGIATSAKKASLPDPLYVYCTKILFVLESHGHHKSAKVSHRFARMDQKKSTAIPRR
jgi:hypothetical protein